MADSKTDEIDLIKPKELARLLSISIPTLYRWESEGVVPINKIKFGNGSVRYRKIDVIKWLSDEEVD